MLVDALCHVPCRYLPKQELPALSSRLAAMLGTGNPELDIIALHMLLRLTYAEPGLRPSVCAAVRQYAPRWEEHLAHDWLRARLLAEPFAALDAQTVSQIHLSNLKNAVHWTVKLTQINMLLEYVRTHRRRRSTRRCIFPICSASASIFPCARRQATRCFPSRLICLSTRSTKSSST